ncbi:MAG: nucleoside-diphosphate kinase [Candidatus Nealsonbacteria bacterium CG23_combo_of_CG06-09_8_20_14_all_40_13]|uniref:nucleoside-diphosphate kinase n=1 Tax=Candidatus Nealsonbacteria bacterium CG23_combo_of_CG06-09_8_20_14_all_40_13 TaxID=1974724 RepID=A0A2G9YRL3_9BACT|nr:MAG: nucleoside-diphosphate kinase [Candidatus Nealsonbacteria bacterium CG23_combo_of_CG06-09_8_20_14_all_40_13]PIR71094.1 MAG: nucleoside-diphosphate kinase [Candidatus Nealsonbacteria bacterium CG10_big_fil_rev_8_21_14_0_10_40_24]PIU43487.1 MAG: nucleoside-diphosphate kinase [Candidatus Nealsonbacteria bacterium CG07_land_8_20_14_0_80_40_10]
MKNSEKTLIAIKPESIQRQLIGEFINKFEKRGLKLVGCKLVSPNRQQVETHYPDDEAWYVSSGTKTFENYKSRGIDPKMGPVDLAKRTRARLIEHLVDRPLLLMVWEGPHAVALGRKTAGATNPLAADIGSIRGDYSAESYELADDIERAIHTLVHASGSVDEAKGEIAIWFKQDEILDYDLITETVFYAKDWGKIRNKKK